MQILSELSDLRAILASWRQCGQRIALVPTMGALHDGHLALVERARTLADRVVASIFVNPLQFNDPADLDRYPRQEAADADRLRAAGCDLLWLPTPAILYPAGFATTVSVGGISARWEGAHRPGHFDGVATVVTKLFTAVRPDTAIFGEKDYQQLAVIRRLERDLDLGVTVVGHPTVREADGLAMSSRNALLGDDERAAAPAMKAALDRAAAAIREGQGVAPALAAAHAALSQAGFGPIDYVAYVDGDSLEPLDEARPGARLLAAAFLGRTRLIDNICGDQVTG